MARTTNDPKRLRITIRISEADLSKLHHAAEARGVKVGTVVRDLIRHALEDEPALGGTAIAEAS